jgi:hypothetical protein
LAGIDPVRTLRGELVKDAKPGRARNGLIGVQVFASALVLICAAIFLRSALASSRSVSSAYFDVLGIPIVRGRAFTDFERDDDPVVIVSESVARSL